MDTFAEIYARAADLKGGVDGLEELLPEPKTPAQLKAITDDRYLAEMTKCVFRAGFVWKIIENKWPGFEEAFHGFDTMACAMLSDEDLEQLQQDDRIVKNGKKIATVRNNASFVREVKGEYGSFGRFLADWPVADITGLWSVLKARGDRLGGNSGPFFLRFVGKDTFMLSQAVVEALIAQGIVDKSPTGKKALADVAEAFNAWRTESGRPLCAISRTLAASVG
jgi:3-methyladenine DNA glycosylase Tag